MERKATLHRWESMPREQLNERIGRRMITGDRMMLAHIYLKAGAMDLGIRGKVALVTGASAGIGEAVALALAREGVRLAVSARRRDRLEDVARRALAGGAEQARSFTADQTDSGSLQALTASVERELGPVEILIVNGGGPKPGSFTQTAAAEWDAAYALTLQSALQLIRAVLPGMRARGWG